MAFPIIPAIGIGASLLGALFGGKKSQNEPTQYTSGMSPQDDAFKRMLQQYLQQKLQQPYQYAKRSSATPDALKMLYKNYFGKTFTPPTPGTSAQV